MAPRILVKRLRLDAVLPRAMSELAAGMDLCAALDAPLRLAPGERLAVATGLSVAIPPGWEGQVRPRSGLALTRGITVLNAPGTIDADYRGELLVLLVNLDVREHVIEPGERIAQLVIAPVARAEVEEVTELEATERGAGGFGSTGQKAP
jgi:dUTP diphosphatase